MPTTRKKVIKTIYKDDSEDETGDFSDSGSEAKISDSASSSDEDDEEACDVSSGDEFKSNRNKPSKSKALRKPKPFAKSFINKLNKTISVDHEDGNADDIPIPFSIKDLSDADKLLPSVLNLSESDSSDDELPINTKKKISAPSTTTAYHPHLDSESDKELDTEYKDVFSSNFQDNSEEIAKKTFLELELHKTKIDQTKATIQSYKTTQDNSRESDVKDLLAQGGEVVPQSTLIKKKVKRRARDDSDSDMEDWEEVKESKAIPQQGLQLIVDIPDAVCRKTKKLDVEMMMKRKINRVKKEYQVYMHKVHVLCWLGHGNYVSGVLNGQELLAAALSLVPSKECYPGERVDMKYLQQISVWYKDKISLKQDKNEDKFRPRAPPLKDVLITQIKNRVVTTKKYMVFIFVSMLRALGLQCRVMFNFITLPLKPPTSELCSLSTKPKNENKSSGDGSCTSKGTVRKEKKGSEKTKSKPSSVKSKVNSKISQVDGNFDYSSQSDSEMEDLVQLDGSNDVLSVQTRKTRASKMKSAHSDANINKEDVSPSKRPGKSPSSKTIKAASKRDVGDGNINREDVSPSKTSTQSSNPITVKAVSKTDASDTNISKDISPLKRSRRPNPKTVKAASKVDVSDTNINREDVSPSKRSRQSPSPITVKATSKTDASDANINKDNISPTKRSRRSPNPKTVKAASKMDVGDANINREDVSPPKRSRKSPIPKSVKTVSNTDTSAMADISKQLIKESIIVQNNNKKITRIHLKNNDPEQNKNVALVPPLRKSRNLSNTKNTNLNNDNSNKNKSTSNKSNVPEIVISRSDDNSVSSKYFGNESSTSTQNTKIRLSRKRSQTTTPANSQNSSSSLVSDGKNDKAKSRTKSMPSNSNEKSKYFSDSDNKKVENKKPKLNLKSKIAKEVGDEDKQRVSHRDLRKGKTKPKNDVTGDLIDIIKTRVKEVREESKKGIVKGKVKLESDEDSDYLPEEVQKGRNTDSDDDFKPTKISPKPSTSRKPSTNRKIDRRVLSSDEESPKNKLDVWCEVYVEELEQWISIDIISGKLHCSEYLYSHATHPVAYVVGWDNNNYLKDLTRRYVPQWNTVTRKQRAEPTWWNKAIQPWLGPKTARDKEEDENLDRMQLDAPLPKSIAEYKNHPLYALKRHLLKFQAIYPPDAVTLGFVRGEPVYGRDCVYTCRSRDTWLKEAKVVRLGEHPYKVVKARPKWDKLSNKLITDKPLEVFGPWQVQDYEPPVAENGIVPRNAYGNVELFKDCMLPKGTVHIKLPGLNKVARKLNIDCAPAMTGFDFNGGWSHPVYDGFVVCKEFEELITDAWVKDQEEQERKEREKTEARVYGNWRRLIKGLFIRERLKCKYGFEDPSTSKDNNKKNTGPRFVVKKK